MIIEPYECVKCRLKRQKKKKQKLVKFALLWALTTQPKQLLTVIPLALGRLRLHTHRDRHGTKREGARRSEATRCVAGVVAAHFAWAQQNFQGPVPIAIPRHGTREEEDNRRRRRRRRLLLLSAFCFVVRFALTSASASQSINSDLLPA